MDIKNITLGDILSILSIIASLWAAVKLVKEIRKPREDRDKAIDKSLKEHTDKLEEHDNILASHTVKLDKIDTTLENVSEAIHESSESSRDADILIKTAICSIQRQTILDACTKCLESGKASLEQKETISSMYKSYHDLGGNSFVTQIVEQVMKLPLH